jgi:hypothetical protein
MTQDAVPAVQLCRMSPIRKLLVFYCSYSTNTATSSYKLNSTYIAGAYPNGSWRFAVWPKLAPSTQLCRQKLHTLKSEIAATAAALIVEEGLEYGPAKRRAVKQMALPARTELPDNDMLEESVREYIAVFCADTQPAELAALRQLAVIWMQRMSAFRPYLTGAVWNGTATRLSDIYIQLFCDDSKSAEIALIEHQVDYEPRTVTGFTGGNVEALSLRSQCKPLNETVGVHLMVYDHNDLRGALRPDSKGRPSRGDLGAVQKLISDTFIGGIKT